ncbi:MAG: cysteine--tRNA ligase [Gemmobacter sp.]|uniref:cysteine--tRNA ligase n=1 Tax=Gemmobacter sp. TaxID=1898957 RepID=UPI00391A3433
MTPIRLRNTLTRKVQDFVPIDPANVRMYVCGPTVYDRAHLGNARPVVVFDVLYRLLRHVYGADHVTYVRNFTDVDDKINAEALRRKAAGRSEPLEALIRERTEETIAWYHADMDALGALRPDHEPRATDYIPQMIAMIEGLIARGHAYAAEGHVLFRVRSFAAYGALSGRSVDDMIAGARVEVAPFKEDPMDFVLWKPSDDALPGWPSPWGRGRPGWHIECSAMSDALLGATFDIHAGGLDLQFPHHENEIAQSCCAHGAPDPATGFAHTWLHNEMLLVEGRKMSKSLGNFFTVRDLLNQGVPGEVIRYVFLMTHYGKPMDWTAEKAREAEGVLRRWRGLVAGIEPAPSPAPAVLAALADDLNTAGALAALHGLAAAGDAAGLRASAAFLGLLEGAEAPPADLSGLAARLAALRTAALASKDFAAVDALKTALLAAGVEVRMSKSGVELVPGPGFDPARLEGLA